jgi:hypothetical protein
MVTIKDDVAFNMAFNGNTLCHNPCLGLATKARACKVAGQEES